PTNTYTAAGTYIIKQVVTNANGCKDSSFKTVVFNGFPTAAFGVNTTSQCLNQNSFLFTNTSANVVSSVWNFGDGNLSTKTSATHTYTSAGVFTVKLLVTNANGCKDSISTSVVVIPSPVSSFSFAGATNCTNNRTVSIINNATNAVSYYYDFGDGTTSTLSTPTKTYATLGTYLVKQIVTSLNGCKDSSINTISFDSLPTAVYTTNSSSQCLNGNSFVFTNTSNAALSSVWSFGDGDKSTQNSTSHSFVSAGIFAVKLVVTNAAGCKDSLSRNVTVLASPNSLFGYTGNVGCTSNRTITVVDSASNALNYFYDFGDGTTSTLVNPSKTYSSVGTYIIKQVVTNANGCKDSSSKTISFSDFPIALFNVNTASQCVNNNAYSFVNASNNAINYFWDFGDGTTSSQSNPTQTYNTAGTYTVKLIAISTGGCKDSTTNTITILPKPTAVFTFTGITNCTNNRTINIVNNAIGATSYYYDFGDGTTSTLAAPSKTYTTTGVFTIKQVVTNVNGCKDSTTKTVTFTGIPIAAFTAVGNANCSSTLSVVISNTSTDATIYNWSFGDGTTSTLATPTKTYANTGTYTIKLVVSNAGGCKDSTTKVVTVSAKPIAAFTIPNFSNCSFGNTFNFNNISTNAVSYAWNFGDGGTSNLLSPSYTYTASGTYNVKLVVKGANGCLDSMIRTISFVARPIAAFTTVASTSCNNSFTFNNTSVSNATSANYMWTFGDASFSILQSPVKAYTNPGTYTVVLVVTNSNGCRDTTSQLVTVAPKPVAAFTIPNFNSCNNGNNITVQSTSTNVTTINWNFGDGTTATGAIATKTYSSAGTYTITLVVANANGCADSTSKIITLSSKPAASFSINSITQCVNSNSYNFTNTSTIPSGTIQYTWLFGDGTTSTLTNPTKVYSLAGTYTVKLIATSASGSCNDTASSQVTVLAKPSSSFTVVNSSLCSNTKTIAFNNTSTNVASTTWNFGDGNTSAVFSPTNTYLNYGTYTVSLITKNTNGCSDTLSRVINIAALPTATFSINNNSQCSAGNNFVFTNTSSNATNYVWSFGDNVGSATTNPSHSYSSVGNFVVSLIATNINGCIDTSKTNVTVKASSVADFTYNGNTNCTSNLTLAFTNNSTNGTSYLWSFGDGINSAATSPTHTYSIAGTYTISLIASNASGCSDTATQTVTFNARPTSSFSIIGATQCVNNNSYSFTNSSINATSYLWSFGDGATSSLELPTHSYTVAGNYTVTLVATNTSGCSSTSTSTITVAAMPSASFTLNNFNACAGNNSIVFNNTSTSAATYSWNFGNGNTSSATNPAITYAVAGTYTITLTATNANGCIDTASQTISLFDKPTSSFNIASSATQCVGSNNFSFINNSINASSYLWNFGDGATSTLNSPTRIYTGSGTFTVTLTVSNTNGCTATSSATVTLLAKPTSSFNLSNYNSCLNNRTISPVNTSTNASSYFWDFGDGILTNETNPVHTYVNAGTYVVTLISLNGNGCTDTLKKTVSIVNKPVSLFAIGGNATQCLNNNIFTFVNYSTNAATYSWDFGDGATATNANTSHTYSSAGTYTITLTVTSTSGCTTTSSQTIIVNNKPNASFVVNAATQCLGGNVFSFTNTSVNINNVSYVWNFGDSNYTTQTNATKIYAKAGTYNVILTATNSNGCVDSAVKTIVVNNTLTSSFVVNAAAVSQCTNATIAFTNKTAGTATSYLWRLGDGTISTLISPSHTYTSAGFYVITLISYSGNCIDSSSQTLIIGDKPTANFTATSANSCSSVYDLVSTSTGSIIAYAWKFSDSTVNANSTLSYGFTKSGNQSIKLVVSSAPGCSDSITKTVNVLPKPTMSYSQNAVVGCINDNNFTFTSTTTASALSISNFWDFGDGTSSAGTSVTKSYSKPGVYNIKLVSTIISTGCKDSLTQPVTVYPKPTAIISGSVAICKGTSAILRFYFKGKSPFTATYTDGKSNFSINNIADTVYDLTVVPDVTTTYRLISVKDAICTASENDLPSTATVTIHTLTYTKQPENVATCLGKDVRFISTAFSNTTFTYQWFKNGIAIPGATDDTLLLTNVSTLDNGFYKLATVLACGSYTSNTVT
ncbi:MAG: PKD domain-containing protein, partial [Bacteroidetes bacterium]|nr:PKD domain-containing protein [Bacteroidota bacterium]